MPSTGESSRPSNVRRSERQRWPAFPWQHAGEITRTLESLSDRDTGDLAARVRPPRAITFKATVQLERSGETSPSRGTKRNLNVGRERLRVGILSPH